MDLVITYVETVTRSIVMDTSDLAEYVGKSPAYDSAGDIKLALERRIEAADFPDALYEEILKKFDGVDDQEFTVAWHKCYPHDRTTINGFCGEGCK